MEEREGEPFSRVPSGFFKSLNILKEGTSHSLLRTIIPVYLLYLNAYCMINDVSPEQIVIQTYGLDFVF